MDLAVDEGEIVGVMGKNGVGKTTLMQTVSGRLDPTAGTLTYAGTDVTAASADERARAGRRCSPSRALVSNPDLLLLDEPSEGIQPSIVDQISEDVRGINEEFGTTVLFVEQNLGLIRELADRCYAMDRGEIVDEVEPETVADEGAIAEYLAV